MAKKRTIKDASRAEIQVSDPPTYQQLQLGATQRLCDLLEALLAKLEDVDTRIWNVEQAVVASGSPRVDAVETSDEPDKLRRKVPRLAKGDADGEWCGDARTTRAAVEQELRDRGMPDRGRLRVSSAADAWDAVNGSKGDPTQRAHWWRVAEKARGSLARFGASRKRELMAWINEQWPTNGGA